MAKVRMLTLSVTMALVCASSLANGPQSGIDQQNFDSAVRHQDDFYLSVNGGWLQRTEIPADKSNYGSFSELVDQNQLILRTIIEKAAESDAVQGSDLQKIGDFYRAYRNVVAVETAGLAPLQAELKAIAAADNHGDISALFGQLLRDGVKMPFGFYVNNDAKASDQYAVYIFQSGLGLPDREYYFKPEEKFTKLRERYLTFIEEYLTLARYPEPAAAAEAIFRLESKLAEKQWTRVESRDANRTYNKLARLELAKLLGGHFNYQAYAEQAGLDRLSDIIVRQPGYLEGFGEIFMQTPIEEWKAYLTLRLLSGYADYLPKAFTDRHFAFFGKDLRGIEAQQPRWKKAVNAANSQLGELVGRLYVKEHFKPEAKDRMEQLINNLITAFEVSINELEWMSETTKSKALEKLSRFTPKIGYPDNWKDYSNLTIREDDLAGNFRRASNWEYQRMLNKLGAPIDTTEWHMTPQTVNAYYNPVMNEIVFPAAILQPPFFNMAADDAANYGAIGAVIGHEISHGFDDQGSKFDGQGNLKNWWTIADQQEFNKRGKQLVAQYSSYSPIEGMKVNGALTLGENIGDLGGLTVAYKAYQLSLQGKPEPEIDGLTGDQRFFMGWSQIWRRNYREDDLRSRLLTGPHSPSHYRVIGIVSNMDAFYEAFEVKEGDGMYIKPEKRVKIW